MFSHFFCLVAQDSSINLLKNCFDIEFSYKLGGRFFRNLSGQGRVVTDSKFSFKLSGLGSVPSFSSSIFYFFSSEFVLNSVSNRPFFASFSASEKKIDVFEKAWLACSQSFNLDQNFQNIVADSDLSGFPILKVVLVSYRLLKNRWVLELEEV